MSDMKISLPGSETVTLTGQTIDKLIRAGNGDAALLYLYILKTHGHKTSSEAAIALDKSKGWVASAMAVLSRLGLVQLDNVDSGIINDGANTEDGANINNKTRTGSISDAINRNSSGAAAKPLKPPLDEPRKPTEQEVHNELMSGSDFAIVVDETQRRLGKILSPDDLLRLFGIYDQLRLPAEVILQLITHCIKECSTTGDGGAPSIRYIEKAAYTWEREEIYTFEKAEEYLKALEERKSIRGEMKKALHIRERELSATEKRYVDSWVDMGFEPRAIAVAYDKTVTNTGSLAWPYIDKIVNSWHNKDLHTLKEVMESDGESKRKQTGASGKPGLKGYDMQKHGEPNMEEMERLRRLLDKTKEDDSNK